MDIESAHHGQHSAASSVLNNPLFSNSSSLFQTNVLKEMGTYLENKGDLHP